MTRWSRRVPAGLLAALLVCCVTAPGSSAFPPTRRSTAPAPLTAAPLTAAPLAVVVSVAAPPAARVPAGPRQARLREVVRVTRARTRSAERPLLRRLRAWRRAGLVTGLAPLWIVPSVRVSADPATIRRIARLPGVVSVVPDALELTPSSVPAAPTLSAGLPAGPPAANQTAIGSPAVWSAGETGEGVVVATLDSGVDATHPDLAGRWRGGAHSWFDPFGEHPATPTDLTGHGTGVMGVILAGDASGESLGTAPGATWMAARVFDDAGHSTVTATHQAFQWLLDPDGDPQTADAPQVVNASWSIGTGPSCDLTFQPDVQALRAAGILTVFPSGNFGPGVSTSVSPANYPESLSVGGLNSAGTVRSDSGRGPSDCGGRARPFPDLVAPGQDIVTTDRWELYQTLAGTSVAAPHVAGVLALVLGARPGLSPDAQQTLLLDTAHDLGVTGPDETYGAGRVDAQAAYAALPPVPDFTLVANPDSAEVLAGGSVSVSLDVASRGGFAGDIVLSADPPADSGLTATADPGSVTGGTGVSLLTVHAAPTATPGAIEVLLTGTSGALTRQATLTVQVAQPADLLELSTLGDLAPPGVSGGDDADTYAWNGVRFASAFDATAAGLPASADLDGFTRSGTAVYASFADGVRLPGPGFVADEDVVRYDGGTWSLFFDGSRHGLGGPGGDVDAVDLRHGALLISTRGGARPRGVRGATDDADIYAWKDGRFRRTWDATAHGLPRAADVDGLASPGTDRYCLSFSTAGLTVPTLGLRHDEDIVRWSPSGWTVLFDGAAAGLGGTPELDVDAFALR